MSLPKFPNTISLYFSLNWHISPLIGGEFVPQDKVVQNPSLEPEDPMGGENVIDTEKHCVQVNYRHNQQG